MRPGLYEVTSYVRLFTADSDGTISEDVAHPGSVLLALGSYGSADWCWVVLRDVLWKVRGNEASVWPASLRRVDL